MHPHNTKFLVYLPTETSGDHRPWDDEPVDTFDTQAAAELFIKTLHGVYYRIYEYDGDTTYTRIATGWR